jgi:hypothetical protein
VSQLYERQRQKDDVFVMTTVIGPLSNIFTTGQITTGYVKAALEKGGYTVEFTQAKFLGISTATGRQVHIITYRNDDGELEDGEVFIDSHGTADF